MLSPELQKKAEELAPKESDSGAELQNKGLMALKDVRRRVWLNGFEAGVDCRNKELGSDADLESVKHALSIRDYEVKTLEQHLRKGDEHIRALKFDVESAKFRTAISDKKLEMILAEARLAKASGCVITLKAVEEIMKTRAENLFLPDAIRQK